MGVNKIVIEVNIPDSYLDELNFENYKAVDHDLVGKFLEERLGINRLLTKERYDINSCYLNKYGILKLTENKVALQKEKEQLKKVYDKFLEFYCREFWNHKNKKSQGK